MLFKYWQVRTFTCRHLTCFMRSFHSASRLGRWPSSVTVRGKRSPLEAMALRKKACAAAMPHIFAQQKVNGLTVLIDRTVQIVPSTADTDIRFIYAPRSSDASTEAAPALFKLGNVTGDPSQYSRVRNIDTALCHQFDQVAVAQLVTDVPAHAKQDDLSVEQTLSVNRITDDGLRH